MMPKHIHADLIHAWAEGAEIQTLTYDGHWRDETFPEWHALCEYRIKARTVKKEGWGQIVESSHGVLTLRSTIFRTPEDEAHYRGGNYYRTVKIEWEEEV